MLALYQLILAPVEAVALNVAVVPEQIVAPVTLAIEGFNAFTVKVVDGEPLVGEPLQDTTQ